MTATPAFAVIASGEMRANVHSAVPVCLPASQSIHADAVAAEYLPGAQLEQEALGPTASVKRPAVQESHTV